MRACPAHDAVTRMRDGGDATTVVGQALRRFADRFGGNGGLICLDVAGRAGVANNHRDAVGDRTGRLHD